MVFQVSASMLNTLPTYWGLTRCSKSGRYWYGEQGWKFAKCVTRLDGPVHSSYAYTCIYYNLSLLLLFLLTPAATMYYYGAVHELCGTKSLKAKLCEKTLRDYQYRISAAEVGDAGVRWITARHSPLWRQSVSCRPPPPTTITAAVS